MAQEKNTVTVAGLVEAFSGLGISRGDSVIVHSSLRSLGRMERGADGVLDALLEAIGPRGNLVLPTFNYTLPAGESFFDPATTPCRTGIIPETGRKRPGALRSLDPTHSVTVLGPDAGCLVSDHLEKRTFGPGSPLDRLVEMGGKILLLGVTQTSNSTIHVGEERAGSPKEVLYSADLPRRMAVRLPDGTLAEKELDPSPSCSVAFNALEYPLRRRGEIADQSVGATSLYLVPGAAVIRAVEELLSGKPDILLCRRPGCRPCSRSREIIASRRN